MDNGTPPDATLVSTVGLTLKALIELFKKTMPELNVVYDEQLSYETAVQRLRSDNNLKHKGTDFYPAFAFKRSPLRYSETAPGRRSIVNAYNRGLADGKSVKQYHSVQADMDLQFLFITKSALKLEEFEIKYLSEDGISKNKVFTVDLTPDLGGPQDYFAFYSGLESQSFEQEGKYFKMLTGTIKLRGFYSIILGNSPVITSIQKQIHNFYNSVLFEQETVT